MVRGAAPLILILPPHQPCALPLADWKQRRHQNQQSQGPFHPGLTWSFRFFSQNLVSANLPLPIGTDWCYPGPKGLWFTTSLREICYNLTQKDGIMLVPALANGEVC